MPKGVYPHYHMYKNKFRKGKDPVNKKYYSESDIKSRVCSACGENKPISEFYKSSGRYYQRECKECTRIRKRKWYQTEKGKRSSANTKLKRRFGITLEEYEAMVEKAGGKCEICGTALSYNDHRLVVDHDHENGGIRGILCKACNLGIGNLQHDVNLLYKAIQYLETTGKKKEKED